MAKVQVIEEEEVEKVLNWDKLIPKIEDSLALYSKKEVIQPPRLIVPTPKGTLLSMPGYINGKLGCKLVTSFPENKNLPSILANVMMFDSDTGQLTAVVAGTGITGWRTAAASAVATKYMYKGEKNVLSILGAGTQAKSHAMALYHFFKFNEVRIWNRHPEKAKSLCQWLADHFKKDNVFHPYDCNEKCVMGADVICTTTYATEPILKYVWLKKGAHINAVGAGIIHHSELDKETYSHSVVVTDSFESAKLELRGLFDDNVSMWGEVGEIINKREFCPQKEVTVFHSLGMAVEDVAAASLILEECKNKN